MSRVAAEVADDLPELPHITEVAPRSEDDEACLADLREVLERHGALSRFGVTLLHQHFEVGTDEVLVESVDEERRMETTSPAPRESQRVAASIETSWRLDAPSGVRVCERVCQAPYGPNGPHIGNHIPTG
jgi:hypothetical protein